MKVDNEPEITIIRKTRTVRNKHKQLPSLSFGSLGRQET